MENNSILSHKTTSLKVGQKKHPKQMKISERVVSEVLLIAS